MSGSGSGTVQIIRNSVLMLGIDFELCSTKNGRNRSKSGKLRNPDAEIRNCPDPDPVLTGIKKSGLWPSMFMQSFVKIGPLLQPNFSSFCLKIEKKSGSPGKKALKSGTFRIRIRSATVPKDPVYRQECSCKISCGSAQRSA